MFFIPIIIYNLLDERMQLLSFHHIYRNTKNEVVSSLLRFSSNQLTS